MILSRIRATIHRIGRYCKFVAFRRLYAITTGLAGLSLVFYATPSNLDDINAIGISIIAYAIILIACAAVILAKRETKYYLILISPFALWLIVYAYFIIANHGTSWTNFIVHVAFFGYALQET